MKVLIYAFFSYLICASPPDSSNIQHEQITDKSILDLNHDLMMPIIKRLGRRDIISLSMAKKELHDHSALQERRGLESEMFKKCKSQISKQISRQITRKSHAILLTFMGSIDKFLIDDACLKTIGKVFKYFKITTLSLDIHRATIIELSGLGYLNSLIHLRLNVWHAFETENDLIQLTNSMKKLENVQTLDIVVTRYKLNEDSILKLNEALESLSNLRKMKVTIRKMHCMISKRFIHGLKKLSNNLIWMELELCPDCFDNSGVVALAEAVEKQLQLRNLILSFSHKKISDYAMIRITRAIKKLTLLKSISLKNFQKMTIAELNAISDIVLTGRNLVSFDLHIGEVEISHLKILLENIFISLHSFKTLKFVRVYGFDTIIFEGKGHEQIYEQVIKFLPSLQEPSSSFTLNN